MTVSEIFALATCYADTTVGYRPEADCRRLVLSGTAEEVFGMATDGFQDKRLGVYCCAHLFRHERPVLLVVRGDGDWQFLCGNVDHDDPLEPYHVSLGLLLDSDPSLHQIADLSADGEAERPEIGGSWLRTRGQQ